MNRGSRTPQPLTRCFVKFAARQFTDVQIHTLNSFSENIAVFREALVQFSVGGRHFDHHGPPVRYEHARNVTSSRPRWITIPLSRRVGRIVKVTLTFDSDWIILSEVAFNSSESSRLTDDGFCGLECAIIFFI